MKKLIAAFLALLSGLYLATLGILPDPLPFLDEGIALLLLLNCLAYLGLDLRGFLGRKPEPAPVRARGRTIDVR